MTKLAWFLWNRYPVVQTDEFLDKMADFNWQLLRWVEAVAIICVLEVLIH